MVDQFKKTGFGSKGHSEADRWKARYETLLQEHEQFETQAEKRAQYLLRLITKVSNLNAGFDKSYDAALNALLNELKSTESVSHLSVQLDAFSQKVIQLDAARIKKNNTTIDHLIDLLEQLAKSSPLKPQRKKIAKLARQLVKERSKQATPDLFDTPHWLAQLSDQQKHLLDQFSGVSSQNTQSFWRRLFGSDDESTKTEVEIQQEGSTYNDDIAAADLPEQTSPIAEPEQLSSEQADLSTTADKTVVLGQLGHSGESIDEEIKAILLALLADVTIPDDVKPVANKLYQQLQDELPITELVPVLDDVVVVVSAALRRDQVDFEEFLQVLDQRLSFVNAFIKELQYRFGDIGIDSENLTVDVEEQVSQIRESLNNEATIESLKDKVSSNIDNVSSMLRAFDQKQKDHISHLEGEMVSMKAQVQSLEAEAVEAKENLILQREKLLRDSLTELPNREAYDLRFADEFARWERYQRPLTFVMADIDLFKSINDNYGHAAGDKVLKLVAKVMREQLRTSDFVARYGGEEFAIILPETNQEAATLAIEKIRVAIESCPFNFKQEPLKITCSFGVTSFCEGDTIESVFERADAALYQAKGDGRNRFVCAA